MRGRPRNIVFQNISLIAKDSARTMTVSHGFPRDLWMTPRVTARCLMTFITCWWQTASILVPALFCVGDLIRPASETDLLLVLLLVACSLSCVFTSSPRNSQYNSHLEHTLAPGPGVSCCSLRFPTASHEIYSRKSVNDVKRRRFPTVSESMGSRPRLLRSIRNWSMELIVTVRFFGNPWWIFAAICSRLTWTLHKRNTLNNPFYLWAVSEFSRSH